MAITHHHATIHHLRSWALVAVLVLAFWLLWLAFLQYRSWVVALSIGYVVTAALGFLGDRVIRSAWSIPIMMLIVPAPIVLPFLWELTGDYIEQNDLSVASVLAGVFVTMFSTFWAFVAFGGPALLGAAVSMGLRQRHQH